jgi:hypothetical protein
MRFGSSGKQGQSVFVNWRERKKKRQSERRNSIRRGWKP